MWTLPWKLKLERRPRPLPQEFNDLVLMVDQLAEVVGEVRKMAEATRQKVYRDGKDDGGQQYVQAQPAVPVDTEWRTGDPSV